MDLINRDRLAEIATAREGDFAEAEPFPHIVMDDFLPSEVAEGLLRDFHEKRDGWKHYHHYNERKSAVTELDQMPPHTQTVMKDLLSQQMIDFIAELTGITGLISDPDLEGAGMHRVEPGGHLNIHTDFLTHTKKRSWRREINLLIYLNQDWQADWNGNLELWDAEMKGCVHSVPPAFNRCVIFNTIPGSYHGHPHKLACPPGESRKHILLYYYRDMGRTLDLASTDYRALPSDSLSKKLMIALDAGLVRLYTSLKGRTKLSDRAMDKILKYF